MKLPDWLPKLTQRDEKLRAAHGLTAKKDGWHKSYRGRTRYIAKPMPVPEAVKLLPEKLRAIDARAAGEPRRVIGGLSLEGLVELYLAWLRQRLEPGSPLKKLARRTYDDIVGVLSLFAEVVGGERPIDSIGADDFTAFTLERFTGKAASTIRREIIYIEAFANWAAPGSRKAGHLTRPWQYGPDFRKPSEDDIATSAADSDKAYTPAELRRALLAVRDHPALRAAGWLALCAALQPKDAALLPLANLSLDEGLVRWPRGKTGVGRLAVLPSAAVCAIRRYLEVRPEPSHAAAKLLFVTGRGTPYYREPTGEDAGPRYDSLGNQWSKRTGLPFSGLRSTFATHADDWSDQRAVDVVLGHKTGHAARRIRSKHYAKRFDPSRVRRLLSHVLPLAFGRVPRTPGPSSAAGESPVPSAPPAATAHKPRMPTPSPGTGGE